MTNKERLSIDTIKDLIPEAGLGDFVEGYSGEKEPFNYNFLWWILFPVLGWLFLLMYFLNWKNVIGKKFNVYLFEKGFIWETVRRFRDNELKAIKYNEIEGIANPKTRHYQSRFGFECYTQTGAALLVCDKNGTSLLSESFQYKNEFEEDDRYNAVAFGANAIMERWNTIALARFNEELRKQGFVSFYTIEGKGKLVRVDLGRDFLKEGDNYVGTSSGFRYSFDSGLLFLYPSEEDRNYSNKKRYFTINVNNMYNKTIFLLAASQFLGVK